MTDDAHALMDAAGWDSCHVVRLNRVFAEWVECGERAEGESGS